MVTLGSARFLCQSDQCAQIKWEPPHFNSLWIQPYLLRQCLISQFRLEIVPGQSDSFKLSNAFRGEGKINQAVDSLSPQIAGVHQLMMLHHVFFFDYDVDCHPVVNIFNDKTVYTGEEIHRSVTHQLHISFPVLKHI